MYKIEFYFDTNNKSEIIGFLKTLYKSGKTNKTPPQEIKKAQIKLKDHIERHGE